MENLLHQYYNKFRSKELFLEEQSSDVIMEIFNIRDEDKQKNKQYWGRELGMLWQKLVICHFKQHAPAKTKGAIRYGRDEPCDLRIENYAIDTKYRIGSGDAGTLKKFKVYAEKLKKDGYIPIMLLLRNDNLPAAISACEKGGWECYSGENAFSFIQKLSGEDLFSVLSKYRGAFDINSH